MSKISADKLDLGMPNNYIRCQTYKRKMFSQHVPIYLILIKFPTSYHKF